ncbi:uncharacterized protein LOC105249560 [Camponotus floridanus]|uniref:uncharacterized protein LOC105249560 n=1 Tax=Camponotus floridanus TaxID=104421 RepID=UPI000DC69F72|nr:uncharacterized protein LOC105249560 [Camponotus floridanus]
MNLLTIILCILMKTAIIIAKTQRLFVTHSPDINQNKLIVSYPRVSNEVVDYKILETRGEGYNYTDDATMITVKRKTSPIRLPILSKKESLNMSPIRLPILSKKESLNMNEMFAFGLSLRTPSIFPTMPLFSRYYLPSKSLYSYNTDTGVQVQKDDYADTELKAPEA